jgi:uncharacterized protein YbjT (DUF2867 family)
MDVVYYLVHSMGTSKNFVAEEAESARNVVGAARAAGVRRVVYLGGLHPDGAELSRHLASHAAVGDILVDSGIETVVLQAGIVIGSGSASFQMIRHLTDRLPVMTAPKWVHNKIQPISIDDTLYYLVAALLGGGGHRGGTHIADVGHRRTGRAQVRGGHALQETGTAAKGGRRHLVRFSPAVAE